MLALYRRGARNEALAVYRDGSSGHDHQLGLPPSPQLRRLQQFMYPRRSGALDPVTDDLLSMEAHLGPGPSGPGTL